MEADAYQEAAYDTAMYGNSVAEVISKGPFHSNALFAHRMGALLRMHYVVLKLNGEAGEVAEQVGKALRDDKGEWTTERRDAILKEVGDVLWYCAAICTELDTDLSEVMQINLEKLQKRQEEGKISGQGSDR